MKKLNLQKYLDKYKNTTIDFYRFPGNYGDSLIWHGTKKLLASLNITEQYVDISSVAYNKTLFIDGGGNFVDYYSDVRDFLLAKPAVYDEIVILPHTIFGERQIEILNSISSRLTVFCREKFSADFLNSKLPNADLYLWHDCAFYNKLPSVLTGKGTLNAFRSDGESILPVLPKFNNDISHNGYAKKPLDEFIATLKKYEQINTDRLHVAIGAALMGKKVRLFPNSYYKNQAVFEYSLGNFKHVNFITNFTYAQYY